LWIR
jgi:hypothetical protein